MARRLVGVGLLAVFFVVGRQAPAQAAAPTIASISPTSGTANGGTDVIITGTNLNTVTSVTFDATAVTPTGATLDGTQMFVTTPAHAAGQVNVVVTNPEGSDTEVNGFTYITSNGPAPTVTGVTPNKGTSVGGTAITITGTNFRKLGDGSGGGAVADATVKIGSENATSVVVADANTITAVTGGSADGSAGAATVTVTNSDGTSGSLGSAFTYVVFCDADVKTNCITAFTVDPEGQGSGVGEGAAPVGVDALLLGTDTGGFQVSIVNNNNTDRFELDPAIKADVKDVNGVIKTPGDLIKIVIEVGPGKDPVVAVSTGDIQSQGFRWNDATDEATGLFKPRASSWSTAGCALPPGTCAERATVDYKALALLVMDSLDNIQAQNPSLARDLQGLFLSTNAQTFSIPTYNNGAFSFQAGSPHFHLADTDPSDNADDNGNGIPGEANEDPDPDGDPNEEGFFNFFISDQFALNQYGIADTSVFVSDPTLLTVTIDNIAVEPTITDVAASPDGSSPAGIKIAFEGFHYSVEDVKIIIAPTVSSISPTSGRTSGGTAVTITGLNFRSGATVSIGGVAATSVTVVSSTKITAVTGAHASGLVSVVVTNSDATTDTLASAFTYVAAPTLFSMAPASGKTAGGTAFTLTGTGFLAGATVTVGGVAATSVTIVSSTTLTAVTGAHAAGTVTVVVTNTDGQTGTFAGAFTYIAPPAITAISPTSGKTAGGTAVTLTGTGFFNGATVTIGGVAATSVKFVSSTSITAVTGAHAAGAADVVVTNTDGQSGTSAGAFTFVAPPTLSSISPTSGKTAGGTAVTLTGTGFLAGATVTIGGVAATSVTIVSGTSITATTGAHAAGAVDVVVANSDGQSVTLAGAFTYVAPPTLSSISPALGTTAGGTAVTLTGTGFAAGATVTIGGVAATSVTIVSGTSITATTGAHAAGAVDVVVANSDGQSVTLAGGFTFVVPTLTVQPTALGFAATKTGSSGALQQVTPAQVVTVSVSATAPAWSASADQTWVQVTNGSGSSSGQMTIGIVNPGNVIGGSTSLTANVTVTAGTLTATVPITLTVQLSSSESAPFGVFDTPPDGATNVTGSIVMSGWALDDIGVQEVKLWRNCVEAIDHPVGACVPAVPGGPANFVFIGNGLFLSGARSDVETAFSSHPQAHRAGWGYLMMTSGLPHLPNGTAQGGQGQFTLSAYAVDQDGFYTLLGTKTITLNNDNATIPFGAIDTPEQNATVTASVYANFGWAVTQSPKCVDTTTTASYRVYIDGVSRTLTPGVNWFAGLTRSDIAAAFPGRCNTNNALAAYYIDKTALGLPNGLHTIGWDVIDDGGNTAGIGSRSFNLQVGSSLLASDTLTDRPVALAPASALASLSPADRLVQVQVGPGEGPFERLEPDTSRRYAVQVPANGRVAIDLGGPVDTGYQLVMDELRAMPGGSTLSPSAGQFAWQPPAPYLGPFHLVFVGGGERLDLIVTLVDPTAPSDVRLQIDTPAGDATVSPSFVVAGWALDPAVSSGSGIDTLHVWAYRRDAIAAPQFLGAAMVGGIRPDVAAAFGAQFEAAGFTLTTPPLAPGIYDLLVYPWSHRAARFEPAQSVQIVVR